VGVDVADAVRVIDRVADMADWDQSSFNDGNLARWDAGRGRFVGVPLGAATGDLSYVHAQDAAATVWVVRHNMGKFPSVAVVDSAGSWVVGDVTYDSPNQLTVSFSAAFAGTAYLN
jgi:hypothetical protein